MSCYILPTASAFVNVAALYQPVVIGKWAVSTVISFVDIIIIIFNTRRK